LPLHVCSVSPAAAGLWPGCVVEWWNSWVSEGWRHKKKQLFLYGPTGTHKTTIVNHLIHDQNLVYRPSQDTWPFSGLQSQHQVILWDEYLHLPGNESELKLVLEGNPCTIRRKGETSLTLACRIPFIFVSNYPPPDNAAIQARLLVICTQGQETIYHTEDETPCITRIPAEVQEEQETLWLPPVLDLPATNEEDENQWEDVEDDGE